MKDISEIIKELDELFDRNDIKGAEKFILDSMAEAESEGNNTVKLHLLNELIGYYRQSSDRAALVKTIDDAILLTKQMDIVGTVPYATTVLNAANGYRSIGELELSHKYYGIAEEIYLKNLSADDMLLAGLYNNISLLYQEEGVYEKAEEYLLEALKIVRANNAGFEIAVTYANLANTAVIAKKYSKAREYAETAIKFFKEINLYDAHYCAALSALGMCYFNEHKYDRAEKIFADAMNIVERSFGHNIQYEKLKSNYDMCVKAKEENTTVKGLELCRKYYEEYGRPMIAEKFPEYVSKIAVGLVGEGSDCFGYDDEQSMDHDWGPGFCMWVSEDTYNKIGEKLNECYNELPDEFMKYRKAPLIQGERRRGAVTISEFYKNLIGTDDFNRIDWGNVSDSSLAAAVNGEVFTDEEGIFTELRNKLAAGYPEKIRFLKIAEDAAKVSQTGQYNYFRMLERGDGITADIEMADCMKNMMLLVHHMNNEFPPHDKWLYTSCTNMKNEGEFCELLDALYGVWTASKNTADKDAARDNVRKALEDVCEYLASRLYAYDYISDVNSYLDFHTDELLKKAMLSELSNEEIVEKIAELEFEAFDKVKNEGGRASCQNDWPTFSVMRKSQYLTWNRTMLMQYYYDFDREYRKGHNLITEKYGRMMESTAPERYEEIKMNFPELSSQKKAVIEQIVAVQMDMMEKFAEVHPKLAGNARSLHTYEDNIINTSYETYLRGEISTYSDKMLQLYGKYVITCAAEGINIAANTIQNTAKLYGFADLDSFEKF